MCACGCFLIAAMLAAIVYCVAHGLWLFAALIVAGAAVAGWYGRKLSDWRPGAGKRP